VTQKTIKQILEDFKDRKIVVVGDVMVDSYIWGDVSRISPEAPVPVVVQKKSEYRMGGAANVARNIKSLGAEPLLCSVIGNGIYGVIFSDLLKQENLPGEAIIQSNDRITTVKTRIISGSQQLLRIDNETEEYLPESLQDELFQRFTSLFENHKIDAIVFQDYDKGVITPDLIDKITHFALQNKKPVLVDPKKRNFRHYKRATLFKPNFKELIEGLNIQVDKGDFDSVYHAAKMLHSEAGFKLIMVTLSEYGILISDDKDYNVIPAEVRDIADVSGAGDTVISMAALCLATGLTPKQTAALSNLAGGLVCEKVGVVPIEKEALLKENFILPED
jgi:D-glycero-beta-D-manno-heptose-7-phosphate kinase